MGKNYQWEETFNERMLKVREALKRNVKKSLLRAEYSNLPDEQYSVKGKATYKCPNKCVDTPEAKGCMACKSPFDKGFDMASFIEFHGGRYKQAVRNIVDAIDDYHKGNVTPTFAERMRKSGLLDLPEEKINTLRKEANK